MKNPNYKDTLGDLLKVQEQVEAGRKADPFLPLVVSLGEGYKHKSKPNYSISFHGSPSLCISYNL